MSVPLAQRLDELRPRRADVRADASAGLTVSIASVPDGMAAAVLAGVNPVNGLYAALAGPLIAGLFTRTQLMLVTTTSAAALAAGGVLTQLPANERADALVLLVVLAGAAMFLAGALRLGRFTRFVSHSVMSAFLTGVAALIILDQATTFAGADLESSGKIERAVELVLHPLRAHAGSLLAGVTTLTLAVLLERTRLRPIATLGAVVVPSVVVALASADGVELVEDVGAIPGGLPTPVLPKLSLLSLDLVAGAFAIAAIVLVQGAGVAESVPRDDMPPAPSRDFRAQGLANVASGLIRGLPVGGSVGQSVLNVSAGARSRWAAVFSGVWMIVILVAFSGLVGEVAMPSLAALLMLAAWRAIDIPEAVSVWRTGLASKLVAGSTFAATLVLPIQAAVGLGVALSALLYLNQAATDVRLVRRVEWPDGSVEEQAPPQSLDGRTVTVLDVYGSVFFAGAKTVEEQLPKVGNAERPVVVLRLRGRTKVGATFVEVLDRYASDLGAAGGRLYLTGIDAHVRKQIDRTGKVVDRGAERIFDATPIVGESTRRAVADAREWLATEKR